MKTILLAIFLTWLGPSLVYAHTIELTGTIRDFSSDHPDFEGSGSGLQTGCVDNLITDGGVPLASNNSSHCAISQLEDWYSDTHLSCFLKSHTITLDNGQTNPGGTYQFHSNSFFPIDGELDGNEGRSHNYHFTFELRFMFAYDLGQILTVSGDDDIWVYINNQLVIDLGGVHPQATDQVDLQDVAATLGLVEGEVYPFDLFFAERHTVGSNFNLTLENIIPFSAGTNAGLLNMLDKNEATCSLLGTDCGPLNERTINMWVNVDNPRSEGIDSLLFDRVRFYRHWGNTPSDNNHMVQAFHNNIKQTCRHMSEHPSVVNSEYYPSVVNKAVKKHKAIIFCESGIYDRVTDQLWGGWFVNSPLASLLTNKPLFVKASTKPPHFLKAARNSGIRFLKCPFDYRCPG